MKQFIRILLGLFTLSQGANVFGQVILIDLPHMVDWKKVGNRRQKIVDKPKKRNYETDRFDIVIRDMVLIINKSV